jgi:hypothetical protein
MGNEIDNLNTIAIASIAKVNGLTDAQIEHVNGLDFVGTVALAVTSLDATLSGNSTRHWGLSQAYDPDTNQVIFCYGDNNNSDYATCVVMAADKSHGSAVVFSTTGSAYHTGATYNTDDDRLMVAYLSSGDSASGANAYKIISGTMGTKTVTFGSPTTIFDGSGGHGQADGTDIASYNPASNVCLVAIEKGDESGDPNYVYACTVDTSDDSTDVGTGVEFVDTTVERFQLTYDPDIEKTVLIYDNGTKIGARVVSLGGTGNRTITLNTEALYSVNSDPAGGGQNGGTWAVYDTSNNTHHVFIYDGSNYVLNYFTVSGTTVTWAGTAKEQVAQSATNACRGVLYQHNRNKLMTYGHTSSGSGTFEFDIYTFDGTDYTHDSTTGSTTIEASFGGLHTYGASMDGVDHSAFGYGMVFSYNEDLGGSGGHLRAVGVELGD